ncbi:MAG: hypothetical protein ATN36_03435 [Epulopiscium sp. Nele67-Bin005]|nr:MAG: hypothetical protein ATN36_03435 [Epulopiscium sp. Nele67-Bin005]
MYTHNGIISNRQLKILLILQMFNMSILGLPRIVAQLVDADGYWLPFIGFVFGAIYIWVVTALIGGFKGKTFVDYSQIILSKPLGILLSFLFAIKLIISAGLEVRMFAEMITRVLLPNTPLAVIVLTMLFTVHYLVKSGVEAIGRMAEVLIFFVFIPLIFVLIFISVKADYEQLLPFFQSNFEDVVHGGFIISTAFMPLEFVLVLGAFVNQPKKIRGECLKAIAVVSVIQIIVIMLTYTGIGVGEAKREVWPVLILMESIQMPGSFIENQEVLMMAWWIMSVYMYICGGMYVASLIIAQLFNFERKNVTVLPLIPIVYFVAIMPASFVHTYHYFIDFQSKWGLIFLFFVPLILWIIAKMRKVGDKNEAI